MKRALVVTLLVVPLLLALTPAAFATKTYPSVVGDWQANGTMTAKLCVPKFGCERAGEFFQGEVSFNQDQSLALDGDIVGQWLQSKYNVLANLNEAELESLFNEILYEEIGEELFLDITGLSFKSKISKDGSQLLNGKLYVKFEFDFTYSGQQIHGKGTIAMKFTGTRAIASMSAMAADDDQPQQVTPAVAKLIGTLLADKLLSKGGN